MACWYYLGPNYKECLSSRVEPNAFDVDWIRVQELPARRLLELDIATAGFFDGRLTARTSATVLLATNWLEPIITRLRAGDAAEDYRSDHILRLALLDNDLGAARGAATHCPISWDDDGIIRIVIWLRLFDDRLGAARLVKEILAQIRQAGPDDQCFLPNALMSIAKIQTLLLDQADEARNTLRLVEEGRFIDGDLAATWMGLFGDVPEASRCLYQMGPDGKKPRLLLYAHGLMTVFDEFDRAREVLIQCERDARTVEDCTQVALSWAELFDERDRAVRAMARGERLARRALEWFNLKTVWEHFLSEHDRAEWCRSHYERPGR